MKTVWNVVSIFKHADTLLSTHINKRTKIAQTDEQTNRQTGEQTNRQTDKHTNRKKCKIENGNQEKKSE